MEVIIGKNAGFCTGVQRSIDMAEKLLEENKKVYSLGELIHNDVFLSTLYEKGLEKIDNINEAEKGSTVIIRAHGVVPEVYDVKNINLIDGTCPFVKKTHKIVEEYKNRDHYIVIVGEKNHSEVIGIKGYAGENSIIVSETNEIISFNIPICLVSQTTFSEIKYNEIEQRVRKLNKTVKAFNTICNTTSNRQKEVEDISKEVDMMIIIGDKKSSNTKKLYDISKVNCENTIQIYNKEEIPKDVQKYNKIGIMAGASVPCCKIKEIEEHIKEKIRI